MLKRTTTAAALAAIISAPTVGAEYRWRQVVEVDHVDIEYRAVDRNTLEAHVEMRTGERLRLSQTPYGHATLFRASDGSYRCEIWHRPGISDDDLAHEEKHCRGYTH